MAGPWRVRTRKPHSAVRINLANPLARDIAFFYYETQGTAASSATFFDAVTGLKHSTSATQTTVSSTDPVGGGRSNIFCNNGSGSNSSSFTNPNGATTQVLTVFGRFKPTAKPASKCQAIAYGRSDASLGVYVGINSSGFAIGGSNTTNGMSSSGDAVDHTNQWINVGGSGDGSTSGVGVGWVNGVKQAPNFNGTNSGAAVQTVSVGKDAANYYNGFTGEIAVAVGWNRILSDAEHAQLAANPWQLLLPANDFRLFSLPAAGGGSDLTLALTGLASTAFAGTLGATSLIAIGLSGIAATGAVGSVNIGGDKTLALTGSGGTASVGSVAVGLGQALSGNAGTSAINSLGKASLSTIGLTGNVSTGSVGTISVTAAGNKTFAMSGVSAIGSVGNITISGGNVWAPVTPVTSIWTPLLPASTPWTPQ